jgi:DNA-binding CsgD family transcriptional regulator
MDSSLNLISFNTEAMKVLSYPYNLAGLERQEDFIAGKVRSSLLRPESMSESPFVTEFRSGRRRYFCRVFLVAADSKDPSQPSLAVLLERGPSEVIPLSQVSQQFNLTQREREALGYLLQGLSSKAIANRMSISPNTVRAYMRMLMVKTGVSSRSAMVSKIILAQPRLYTHLSAEAVPVKLR